MPREGASSADMWSDSYSPPSCTALQVASGESSELVWPSVRIICSSRCKRMTSVHNPTFDAPMLSSRCVVVSLLVLSTFSAFSNGTLALSS